MILEGSGRNETSSLPEVHASVATRHARTWRRVLAFSGPAYLVSVGYMDPGNWATDIEGGAKFGYRLLWVLVVSNLMALLLQTLSSRLGIVSRRDLAQACRDEYPAGVAYTLWALCEIAIIACDLAEVLGAAIGLQLLFHIPLLVGVAITAADTLLVLWFTRMGIRVIEAFVLALIAIIALCFLFEIWLAHPSAGAVLTGLVPRMNSSSVYLAVAIFGATVMPHNLYLHSALVQTRRIGEGQPDTQAACRYNLIDSTLALNGALFVNAAILVLSAAVFYAHGLVVTEIQDAHKLLAPLLGTTAAGIVFGAALLCSGQSSTLTGTMAGQIVMEGFLHFRIQPWLRRAITRLLAITPAALTIYLFGERATTDLMVLSQVILSLQLPFAVIPLIRFTNDRGRMGTFANPPWVKLLAGACAVFILVLNVWVVWNQLRAWSAGRPWVIVLGCALGIGFVTLLATMLISPARRRGAHAAPESLSLEGVRQYSRILVPLDHTNADREALVNAVALARTYGATLILMHVEEGIPSQLFGSLSSTSEIAEGQRYLSDLVVTLEQQNIRVETVVQHGRKPWREIAETVRLAKPDLIVMASHGHRGIKDLIFGTTINSVRHHVSVPILVVRNV